MKKDSFEFKVPLYNVLVKVIKDDSKDIAESFKNSTGIHKENIMNAMEFAKTIQVDSKTEGSYVVLLLTQYHNSSILVHEAVHMAKAIMRISGIKQPDEETEAYITQYCFGTVDSYYMH